jgi:RecB family exonuclease
MARKPTLSPSKIATYLACPVKYRWTYVDDRGKWYMRARSYYSFGSSLHKVLQRFHDASDAGVATVGQALAAYEESWIDAGYRSAEEMAEAFGEGKDIIERYVEEAQVLPATAKTLWVERMLRKDLGEFALIGRVDRVDEHEDGSLEIVDYKSGRAAVDAEDVANDLAMCCYQVLVKARFPDRVVKATILALRTGSSATASLDDEALRAFEADLIELGREILSREYEEIVPVYKHLCPDCDFLPLCRKHPEFSG